LDFSGALGVQFRWLVPESNSKQVKKAEKKFDDGQVQALGGINLRVMQGELLAIPVLEDRISTPIAGSAINTTAPAIIERESYRSFSGNLWDGFVFLSTTPKLPSLDCFLFVFWN
jgi:hypothetical protein